MFYIEDLQAMNNIAAYLSANSLSESDIEFEPRRSLGWARHRNNEESRNWEDQFYRYITVKVGDGPVVDLEYDFEETTISHLRELISFLTPQP
jgi:hypothetical protein